MHRTRKKLVNLEEGVKSESNLLLRAGAVNRHKSSIWMRKMSDDSLNETLIDRLKQFSAKPNDNVEVIRSAAARLHSRTASQDKNIREKTLERIWRKENGALVLIVSLLESVRDHLTSCSLAGILHECVSPKSGSSRGKKKQKERKLHKKSKQRTPAINQLVAMNTTQSLVKLVVQMQMKDSNVADILLYELIWVLAQLASKDPKFSMKTRLHGAVKAFHNMLRVHHNNTKLLFPILLVIKCLSKNSCTTAVLVKDGIVSTLEKVIMSIGFSPTAKLRLVLNVMQHLTKSRLCCTRVVKTGVLMLLLRIFERWERYDGKMRLRICNYTLVTLKHICGSKMGRKSLQANNGLQLLHRFSVSCPDDKSYDSLLSRVCTIINMCLDKRNLPIDSAMGPASFKLPAITLSNNEIDYAGQRAREASPASDDDSGDDYPDEEDFDDDSSHKDRTEDKEEKGSFVPSSYLVDREIEELNEYAKNFREIHDSENNRNSTRSTSKSNQCVFSFQDTHHCQFNIVYDKPFDAVKSTAKAAMNQTLHMISSKSENTFQQKDKEKAILKHSSGAYTTLSQTSRISNNSEHMVKGLTTIANIPTHSAFHYAYSVIASRVNSVLPFVKVAYPDMMGGDGVDQNEPLNVKDRRVCRGKMLGCVEKGIHSSVSLQKVVFDLDSAVGIQSNGKTSNSSEKMLYNLDDRHVGQRDPTKYHLLFESRFESGNLRKAIQVGAREYDLILMPDVNSSRHHQWFYFEVSNMDPDVLYVFNIINCEKQNSQFNYGMKPLMYSVSEALNGRAGWARVGSDICYYRNYYHNTGNKSHTSYLTATFSIVFPHGNDICYLAYHYPYTYSQLLAQIWKWSISVDSSLIYYRVESLCLSLNNNETPLLTITAPDTDTKRIADREVVFLTARVHPGESNASWVMQGTLNFLLDNSADSARLRREYVFKIVPMLNMEGVINGCHRCGLTDEDLNRRWSRPSQHLHPVIYHTKGLIEYCTRVLRKVPFLFCDYHGHSRRKNVFLYGCSNAGSWNEADRSIPEDSKDYLGLPHVMNQLSRAFIMDSCDFRVERSRESTARVTVWRQFGIKRSYTMESSYCGCDQGFYQSQHLGTPHLKEVGSDFCRALVYLKDASFWREDVQRIDFTHRVKNLEENDVDESDPLENSDSSASDDEYNEDQ